MCAFFFFALRLFSPSINEQLRGMIFIRLRGNKISQGRHSMNLPSGCSAIIIQQKRNTKQDNVEKSESIFYISVIFKI